MGLVVDCFPCREDNIGYLAHDEATGRTAAIDAPDAAAIEAAADRRGWTLTDILITHHHADHTDGILPLKGKFGVTVSGPKAEADKIAGLDALLEPGNTVTIGDTVLDVLFAPGHTLGHIVFHDPAGRHVFTADALFSMGCGRMFEGEPKSMWAGLERLRALPGETLIYCGHEYTRANAKFALSLEPDNAALRARAAEVEALRNEDKLTIPVNMATEWATNPFLRADLPELRAAIGMPDAPAFEVFAAIRKAKDNFR
jgi:hydroxyacylglutathione hydrolase